MKSAILLAGGQSRRMGRDKALLPTREGRLGERVYATLQQTCDEVVVVTHRPEWFPGAFTVPDRRPGQGPLEGLASGLSAVTGQRALLLACDMPFISADWVARFWAIPCELDVLVPVTARGPEPFGSIYHTRVLAEIEAYQAAGGRSLTGFLARVSCQQVSSDERPFYNINRPEDYLKAFKTKSEPSD